MNPQNIAFLLFHPIRQTGDSQCRARRQMLIDLVIEVVPLGVGALAVKADELMGFVLHPDIEGPAVGIRKAGNRFQPAGNVITIQCRLEFCSCIFPSVMSG